MLKLLALTIALCVPLSPQADQARLPALLKDVTVVETWRPPIPPRRLRSRISTVAGVGADGCDTWLTLQPRNDHPAGRVIDWSERDRKVARDGLYVSLVSAPRVDEPATVTFLLPTVVAAGEATAAFERLIAACRPQR